MKFRSKPRALRIFLLFLLSAAFGSFFWWQWASQPFQNQASSSQIFVIQKGETLDSIALRLKQESLIRSPFAFKLFLLSQNLSQKIQAGDFRLRPDMTLSQIASQLTHGTLDVWVTLLEGWRSEEIAQKLIDSGFEINSATWQLEIQNSSLEGYLFPDTYLFPQDASASAIIKIIRANFDQKVTPRIIQKINQRGLSLSQAITLASIVEREVRTDQDRPLVAGILIKRWQAGWPLQADATVQYLQGSPGKWWPQNLTKKDLQTDSPYNTYKSKGLPPAPICNPGLASIKAVAEYQESPYWFYLSDLQGKIHYAQTIEEHNANIAKYLGK